MKSIVNLVLNYPHLKELIIETALYKKYNRRKKAFLA